MPSSDRDEARDYGFADKALALRKRAGLTQRELASLLDVSVRAIYGWEGGLSYPSMERLQQFIVLYLERGGFTAGHKEEEATALWEAARRSAPRRLPPFDPHWFAALQGECDAVVPAARPSPAPATGRAPRHDWGEAPAAAALRGRTEELALLAGWVRDEGCRVVQVVGAGGIGKTALAARLAQEVAPEFPVLYWRSLRNAPPIEDWLAGAIAALSAAQAVPPEGFEARLTLMLALLRQQQALLVLDNLETVLEPRVATVRYRAGYEGYGQALRLLSESAHRGCLLLTSREQPLRADDAAVRALRLGGLEVADAQALVASHDLVGDRVAWQLLVEAYAGNPLALRVVGETIEAVFEGDIAAFLAQSATVFGDIRALLDEQVARLSPLGQSALAWLAVEREPVGLAALAADLGPGVGRAHLVEAVEGLRRRSLLEAGGRGAFTLQPVVLEYTTDRLVGLAQREVLAGEPELLARYALVEAQAREYVRRSQERLIAAPLLEQICVQGGGAAAVERRLLGLLDLWRGRGWKEQGYGPGNVVNLLRLLRGDLRGLDLSHLSVRQAYLANVEAQDTSLAHAHLAEAVLAEAFDHPTSIALSADGALLAAGTSTGEVHLWRVADRTQLLALPGHSGIVGDLALSVDGGLLASGGVDGTVRLWDVESGRALATLQGHSGPVHRVALSADGALLASGGFDSTVKLWELPSGRALATLQGHTSAVYGVGLSDDRRLLASGSGDGTVRLWEAESGRALATLQGHSGGIYGVALSGDGRLLASGSSDGTVRLWEASPASGYPGRALATLQGHTSAVYGVALSGDGRLLASGSSDGTVRLWEASPASGYPGRALATLQGHSGAVSGVALSGDGRLLASSGFDGTVQLWEVASGQALAILEGHRGEVWGLALSGDGGRLASGSYDGTVKLWAAPSGQTLATVQGHSGAVSGVALSGDGQVVASSGHDGTIKLWEASSGVCLRVLRAERRYERMDITGLSGVTEAQRAALLALGAVERTT